MDTKINSMTITAWIKNSLLFLIYSTNNIVYRNRYLWKFKLSALLRIYFLPTLIFLVLLCSPEIFLGNSSIKIAFNKAYADSIAYTYDSTGRVVQAANSTSGNVITYQYDLAGNILSQKTTLLTDVTISTLSPLSGTIGSSLTISGTGFSTTSTLNSVKVNGIAATVTSASSNKLVVTIPSGATSGTVSVTVGTTTVTSSNSFTVTSNAAGAIPTITVVSPTGGSVGTVITLTGTNFANITSLNKVLFNGVSATVSAATTTSLSVIVPINATSGPISVITPFGSAVSTSDFIVPPAGFITTDIIATGRTTENASTALTLNASVASKPVIAFFNGVQSEQYVRVVVGASAASATVQIFDPASKLVGSTTITSASPFGQNFVDLQTLGRTGTYSVVVIPGTQPEQITINIAKANIGQFNLQWVSSGGSNVVNTGAGLRTVFNFSGTVGEQINFYLDRNYSPTSWNDYPKFLLLDSSGTAIWQSSITSSTNSTTLFSMPVFTVTGSYSLIADPGPGSMAYFTFLAGIGGTNTALDSSPATLGQFSDGNHTVSGRIGFQGVAGQVVTLHVTHASGYTSMTLPSTNVNFYYGNVSSNINNGPQFIGSFPNLTADYSIQIPYLPNSGNYFFQMGPNQSNNPIAVQVLSNPGKLISSNSSNSISFPYQGQLGVFTFNASANDFIGIGLAPNGSPSLSNVQIRIYDPSGNLFWTTQSPVNLASGFTIPIVMPTSGLYSIYIVPTASSFLCNSVQTNKGISCTSDTSPYSLGGGTLAISNPITGNLVVGGGSATVSTQYIGQSVRYTYTSDGHTLNTLTVSNVSFNSNVISPSQCLASLRMMNATQSNFNSTDTFSDMLYHPSSISPSSISAGTNTFSLNTNQFLPSTNVIEFQAQDGCTMNMTLNLN